jgi:hypothetical protein
MKLEFSLKILKNAHILNLNENTPSVSSIVPYRRKDRQTDVMKLLVALRIFANAPNLCKVRESVVCCLKLHSVIRPLRCCDCLQKFFWYYVCLYTYMVDMLSLEAILLRTQLSRKSNNVLESR